jgi:translation initiation factor 4E
MIYDIKVGAPHPEFTKQLDSKWTFWYEFKAKRDKGRTLNKTDYLKEVKRGKTFDTIASFWDCWSEVQQVCNSESGDCNYELFKHGVKPVWEDPKNMKGGKCVLTTPRTTNEETMKHWVSLMITLLIGEFGPDVNGVVLSTRSWGSMFAVWVRNSKDKETVDATMKHLRDMFGPNVQIRFQRHQASMRKKFNNENLSTLLPEKKPLDSEVSSIEGEHRDKNKGKEQPRRRSVVTEETKGVLHSLIQEATQAPLHPPIHAVNYEDSRETSAINVPTRAVKIEEPVVETVPVQKRRASISNTTTNKPTVRNEIPKLSDLSTREIGIGLAIVVTAVATSVLSWWIYL